MEIPYRAGALLGKAKPSSVRLGSSDDVANISLLESFRAAGAILLAYDVIISERAGTQVGKCGRATIFRQARVSRL